MANLVPPNKRISDAVDVRSELDLRIGNAKNVSSFSQTNKAGGWIYNEIMISLKRFIIDFVVVLIDNLEPKS